MKRDTFAIAPMSPVILGLTVFVLAIPVLMAFGALLGAPLLWAVVAFIVLIYASVWFWWRPSRFEITPRALDVVFPMRTKETARADILSAELIDRYEFKERFGFAARVGAGGLWGGFGWLWTSRGGWVEFYISRLDGYVLVHRSDALPLLITPADPERFVQRLTGG